MNRPIVRCIRALLPAVRCVVCAEPAARHNLCANCRRELPVLRGACARCALPLPRRAQQCGACILRTPPWDNAASAFNYVFPVSLLIRGVKYRGRLDMATALGHASAAQLCPAATDVDAVIPVPLHWRRRWRRGFNQALELARPVAAELGVPLLTDAVRRQRPTALQTSLDAAARERNTRSAFSARADLSGARVILFDDVLTTGATLAATTRAVRAAGAIQVRVWTCARAHLGIKKPRQRAGFSNAQT